jgi:16S rRNA (cytosine1402-N4)-methyltransferase
MNTGPSRSPRSVHVPVMLREVLQQLDLRPGLVVADGTVGAGGHSRKIWERIQPGGRLIGTDRDDMMLRWAREALPDPAVILHQGSYVELPAVLASLELDGVDRFLMDLGLSSDQLEDRERGFSFRAEGQLDLRFDIRQGLSAADYLATATAEQLADDFHNFGEEHHSRQIASYLVEHRGQSPIRTAKELADAVTACLGNKASNSERHPATRVFQALRIAVNAELQHVQQGVESIGPQIVRPGGLMAVITFHSLEDRLVKQAFRDKRIWEDLTPKPLVASPAEVRINPRSRSAKLRVARRRPASAAT